MELYLVGYELAKRQSIHHADVRLVVGGHP